MKKYMKLMLLASLFIAPTASAGKYDEYIKQEPKLIFVEIDCNEKSNAFSIKGYASRNAVLEDTLKEHPEIAKQIRKGNLLSLNGKFSKNKKLNYTCNFSEENISIQANIDFDKKNTYGEKAIRHRMTTHKLISSSLEANVFQKKNLLSIIKAHNLRPSEFYSVKLKDSNLEICYSDTKCKDRKLSDYINNPLDLRSTRGSR